MLGKEALRQSNLCNKQFREWSDFPRLDFLDIYLDTKHSNVWPKSALLFHVLRPHLYLSIVWTDQKLFVDNFQDVVNLLHNTTEQLRNISRYDEEQAFITEQERKGFIFKVVIAFEGFSLNYSRYHLNESMPQLTNANSKFGK